LLFSCNQEAAYDTKDWKAHAIGRGWSILLPAGFVDSSGTLISTQSSIRFRYQAPSLPGDDKDVVDAYNSDCSLVTQRRRAQMQIDNDPAAYKEANKMYKSEVIVINGRAAILRVPKKAGAGLLSVEIAWCKGWHVTVYGETVNEQQRDSVLAVFKTLDLSVSGDK
jgi:hypothetical protein